MTDSRRTFLKGITLGSGATILSPMLGQLGLQAAGAGRREFPQRFVFVVKSSGIIPGRLEPESLKPSLADKDAFVNTALAEQAE